MGQIELVSLKMPDKNIGQKKRRLPLQVAYYDLEHLEIHFGQPID